MIPISLYLKNFLSYGENVPPLDFTEFDVACLSGDNGHGKSAILDAITWAIWGEARKAIGERSPSDGLLRIGSTEMQVELVFDLEGDRYRILRKYQRKKRKRGVPSLDFQVFDETTQTYKSLTERTIKRTQEKIDRTLRMNYETFINSAFIVQGHVDEFTRRNPTQRKAILAAILDLSRYEALRELAREQYREMEGKKELLEQQLHLLDEELKHKDEYVKKLEDLRKQMEESDKMLGHNEAKRQALEQQCVDLQAKQKHLSELQQQQKRLRQGCQQLDRRIARQEEQIAEVNAALKQEREILSRYKRYVNLQGQNTAFEEKRRQYMAVREQQRTLEQAIQHAKHNLEKVREKWQTERTQVQKVLTETQHTLQRAEEIEEKFQDLQTCRKNDEQWEEQRNRIEGIERSMRKIEQEIAKEKNRLEVELHSLERHIQELQNLAVLEEELAQRLERAKTDFEKLAALEREREQNKEAGTECRTSLESLKEQKKRFAQDLQEVDEKIDILKRSDQPQCPLCQSSLDSKKKEEIESHFQQEILGIRQEEQRLTQEIRDQEARLQKLRNHYKQIEQKIKQLQPVREEVIHAEKALQDSRKAKTQMQELQAKTESLRATIKTKAYAVEQQQQLLTLQQEKDRLGYDPEAHRQVKQQIKTLQPFEGEFSKLEDTRVRHEKASTQLPEIEQHIEQNRTALDKEEYASDERRQLKKVLDQIKEIGYDEQTHERVQRELQSLQEAPTQKAQLDQAQKTAGTLRQTFDELMSERQQKAEGIADLNKQLVELEQNLERLPAVKNELQEYEATLQSLRKERDDLLETRGTYQHRYERCQQLEADYTKQQEKKTQVERECVLYDHLVKIFGKDGIQAYLIENAIPEIEEEANAILSRLTDNRTYIAIESVRDLQSGGSRETLDIKISDELGTRSYEMYSGGEAFRVDFAIRVALSKLLANRAGTRLKTLVIDEGFGTQDARGLEQLVEAIGAISTDFEKILVITHLESLKEAFPVKIEVVKLPDTGSQYQIVR